MVDPVSEDYVNILTHLYSRKASKKTFNKIRKAYRSQTKKDLCDVIREAQKEVIKDIERTPPGQKGKTIRTKAFKLMDYNTWLVYCPVKK